MTVSINTNEFSCQTHLTGSLATIGTAAVLAKTFAEMSYGGGALVALCAEATVHVASYAIRHFSDHASTTHAAIGRTIGRVVHVLGGYFVGNMALRAAGLAPLALGAPTLLLTLGSVAIATLFVTAINDLLETTSRARVTI